jgi:iron complex transport system ATP-binding protein
MSRLHTEQLSLAYDAAVIVEALDLAIPAGQITALVGPNGCGKSTLLRGLARLLQPRGGAAYLDGKAIHRTRHANWHASWASCPRARSPPRA